MPHSFDGHGFSCLLTDAERLAAGALDHERWLTEVLGLVERANWDGEGGAKADLPSSMRDACLAARNQRQAAQAILRLLAGDVSDKVPSPTKGRVLIVDDAQDNRDIAAVVLEAAGFRTLTAVNGMEGLIVAHYASPSVVLMDIALPVLGGIEAARLLKASAVTRAIPVLAYSALPIVIEGLFARLFCGAVRKPATPDQVVDGVERALLQP